MESLRIDVGVHTAWTFDCSGFDFEGVEKLVLTVKNDTNVHTPPVLTREFTVPNVHTVYITPEESIAIRRHAVYDIDKVLVDGTRYKVTENGYIVLREGVGDAIE